MHNLFLNENISITVAAVINESIFNLNQCDGFAVNFLIRIVEPQVKKVAVLNNFVEHSGDVLLGGADSDLETVFGAVFEDSLDDSLSRTVSDGFFDRQKFMVLLKKRLGLEFQKSLFCLKGVKVKDIGLFCV